MGLKTKLSILVICTISFSFSPHPILCLTHDEKSTFLTIHNNARDGVGVGHVSWDNKLEAYAQEVANKVISDCIPQGSSKDKKPYGENLASGYGALSAWEAAGEWVGEKDEYDYASNSCLKGECKHYTQVVWRKSVRIGCASVVCGAGWPFFVCEYDPPGNILGQRPY